MSNSGDQQRFEAIYRADYNAVIGYARRWGARTDPEEIAAEVFAAAWRQLDQIRDPARPWLLTVARNAMAAHYRAGVRSKDKTAAAAVVAVHYGRDHADAVTERDAVLRALNSLSETDRDALRLVAWEDLSMSDAARVVGSNTVAFRMRVSRARRHLAAALTEAEASSAPFRRPKPVEST